MTLVRNENSGSSMCVLEPIIFSRSLTDFFCDLQVADGNRDLLSHTWKRSLRKSVTRPVWPSRLSEQ